MAPKTRRAAQSEDPTADPIPTSAVQTNVHSTIVVNEQNAEGHTSRITSELTDLEADELGAIVECFKYWRHYFDDVQEPVQVCTDHNNLKSIHTIRQLNARQACWALFLGALDFQIITDLGRRILRMGRHDDPIMSLQTRQ